MSNTLDEGKKRISTLLGAFLEQDLTIYKKLKHDNQKIQVVGCLRGGKEAYGRRLKRFEQSLINQIAAMSDDLFSEAGKESEESENDQGEEDNGSTAGCAEGYPYSSSAETVETIDLTCLNT
jgi:predicted ATP-grasp superfamily ATP-dependent carboligase